MLDGSEFLTLVRFNEDGTFDNSFGQNGVLLINVPEFLPIPLVSRGLLIQPDGKLLTCSTFVDTNNNPVGVIYRLNTDGSFDTTFGINGAALPFLGLISHTTESLLLQSDGSIIVLATTLPSGSNNGDLLIYRLNSLGKVDTTFGSPNGYVTLSDASNQVVTNVGALQPNGYLLVGNFLININTDELSTLLIRYQNSPPLINSTIAELSDASGTAQSKSNVSFFIDGLEVCSTQSIINNIWQCSALIPDGTHKLFVVAHYAAGNVNIAGGCLVTSPSSLLTAAIRGKYCAC